MKMDFGSVAQAYSQGRPEYPTELFDWLTSIVPTKELAWDCACGSGQMTNGLSKRFNHIVATDISREQIAHAQANPKVEFHVAPAESCRTSQHSPLILQDDSVDLVNVGIAAHWFNLEAFYKEALRVLKPNGVLALLVYGEPEIEDETANELMQKIITLAQPYVLPQNRHTKKLYATLPFPFLYELKMPAFYMKAAMTADQIASYLYSRTTFMNFIEKENYDPVFNFKNELTKLLATPNQKMHVRWPLAGRIARISRLEKDAAFINRLSCETEPYSVSSVAA